VKILLTLSFLVCFCLGLAQPLKLHPQNPHYFLYQEKPLVLIGSGEHYGSVVNLDFDYKAYLQSVHQDGLNTTRLFTGAYVEKPGDFGIMKNTLAPAEGKLALPWKRSNVPGYVLGGNKFDLNRWDEAYFSRLRDFMTVANAAGVIVEVNLFSAHYGGGWNYSAFNPANNVNNTDDVPAKDVNTPENKNILGHQERYVRKIVRELNGFDNFYFEIQNEPWADQSDTVLLANEYGPANDFRSTLQVVSARSNAWQRSVARWITDEERALSKKHIISQNIGNFHYPVTDPDPAISIFNFHYAFPVAVTENYSLNKVIGFNETGFAGKKDITYRRQAWRFMMSGGGLFNQLDYSFSVGSERGQDTTYKAPGGGSPALRSQFAVLKQLIDQLDLVKLKPSSVVKSSPGCAAFALHEDGGRWIVYLEPMSVTTNDIVLDLPDGSFTATWKDVETGREIKREAVIGKKLPMPPGKDKVVIIGKTTK
jgi:hypothetical protein